MRLDDGKRSRHRGVAKKSRDLRKIAKRSAIGILLVTLLVGGILLGSALWRARQIFKGGGPSALAFECNIDPSKLSSEGDGRVNILLLGRGGPGHEGEDLTDTLMVASLDPCQNEAGLISIPRDLYVRVPDNGSMKINSVYAMLKQEALAEGKTPAEAETVGIDAAERVTEDVLGIPIHYYIMIDFEAFRRAIDTVGGVTINVEEPLYDPSVAWENNWDPLIADVGEQHFDGHRALLYARSRYGSARGDFDRSERQRQILVALRNKVLSLGTFSNPLRISQLMGAFGDHVNTNLSIDDVTQLYSLAQEIDGDDVTSIGLADPPNDFVVTDNIGGLSVVVPRAGLYQYNDIHRFIRTTLRDGFIGKEDPSIVVLNGTTDAGRANEVAETLRGFGYNVVETGTAPTQDYNRTVFINMRGKDKAYTQRYLEQRFNTGATNRVPNGIDTAEGIDFVIIVGRR